MKTISLEEANFVAKAVNNNTRIDREDVNQHRNSQIISPSEYASPLADASLKVIRGYSIISLSVCFRTSIHTLSALNMLDTSPVSLPAVLYPSTLYPSTLNSPKEGAIDLSDFRTVKIQENPTQSTTIQESMLKHIENFLNKHNIGCLIELYVIRDDGNLFDMVFDGLKEMFKSIEIPNILDLNMAVKSGVDLPTCISYAVIGSTAVADPTRLEELAADGIIRVFSNGCVISEGNVDFSILHSLIHN